MATLTPITDEMREFARTFATETGVTDALHEADFIFQFLINNPVFREKSNAVRYYFYDGMNSAKQLDALMREIGIDTTSGVKLLEFASGYGCVTRHFRNHLPYVDSVSCDIHLAATEFIREKIGLPAVVSNAMPELLDVPDDFDITFALSFFSHMPKSTWLRWLIALYRRTRPGGYLVFTTQGIETAKKYMGNPDIPEDGFWFLRQSEQHDLDTDEYGQTVVTEAFVREQVRLLPRAEILRFMPAFWWGHQDTYVVHRKA